LSEISEAGFKAFDANDVDVIPFLQNKRGFFDILSEYDMHLVGIYCPGQFIAKSLVDWFILNSYMKETRRFTGFAEFAASVGCERLVVGGGHVRENGVREKDYVTLSKTLNTIGKVCNDLNLELTYHPTLKTIVETMDQIAKLCELTDPNLVHLTLETGHLHIAGVNLIELINTCGERIDHVHFKDVENGRFAELGKGAIDFSMIMKSLKKIGYSDWVIVEDEINSPDIRWAGSTTTTPLETAKNSKKFLETLDETT
jgi:sugar phosphate isomerase/epimerase